ncbi:MAG TPA: chromosomal replication initiator protein DnaA [Acidimicrobiales bacterium]|nr:chromosomal replication initiator protein DnaA [Acidimicrobiales bacterium]
MDDTVEEQNTGREWPEVISEAQRLWTTCAALLREQVSDPVWHTAFEGVRAVDYDGHTLILGVPSTLAKDRIEGRYVGLVRDALVEAGAAHAHLRLQIDVAPPAQLWTVPNPSDYPPGPATTAPYGRPASGLGPPPGRVGPGDGDMGQAMGGVRANDLAGPGAPGPGPGDNGGVALNTRYTFENFVTGGSNRFAHAAAQSVAEMPARKFNPLFIYGDAGLGKTHLLQSIASYVHDNYPAYRVRYVTSETFLNEFIDSMHSDSRDAFKRRYRDVDVLLVDDVQFFEGKQETVEEFFHTFNHLHQTSRQIVLSSDRSPDQIGIEDRLRSRFQQGLLTDIQPPELETRLAILRKKAELETQRIPGDVLEFIATNITDNIRVLEGALIRVSAFANLTHEPLTVERSAQVLADLLNENQPRPITPALILEETAKFFGFTVEEITSKHRQRPLVTARQIAMYVMRELTELSYPNIAREFGGRDHTTVIHAVEKIGGLMSKDRQIYDQVTRLQQAVRQGG